MRFGLIQTGTKHASHKDEKERIRSSVASFCDELLETAVKASEKFITHDDTAGVTQLRSRPI